MLRWVIAGSRLLHTHRAAILQSGSPPDWGSADAARTINLAGCCSLFEDENDDEDENDKLSPGITLRLSGTAVRKPETQSRPRT